MDWPQSITTFASGAGGCLAMLKLMQMIERRKSTPNAGRSRTDRLFPNGEKDQIIERIEELASENRARRKETIRITESLDELQQAAARMEERLERAGF
jgi:hypothetical protein